MVSLAEWWHNHIIAFWLAVFVFKFLRTTTRGYVYLTTLFSIDLDILYCVFNRNGLWMNRQISIWSFKILTSTARSTDVWTLDDTYPTHICILIATYGSCQYSVTAGVSDMYYLDGARHGASCLLKQQLHGHLYVLQQNRWRMGIRSVYYMHTCRPRLLPTWTDGKFACS